MPYKNVVRYIAVSCHGILSDVYTIYAEYEKYVTPVATKMQNELKHFYYGIPCIIKEAV